MQGAARVVLVLYPSPLVLFCCCCWLPWHNRGVLDAASVCFFFLFFSVCGEIKRPGWAYVVFRSQSLDSVCCSSCEFVGTHEDLEEHLKVCRFEGMKDFLQRVDEKMVDLQLSLNQKNQEIEFLRSMLGKLSERLESLEKSVDMKLGKQLGSTCLGMRTGR